jgi:ABC-2 type transport system ATP-binding protein
VLSEVAQTVDDAVVIAGGRLIVHAPLDRLMEHGGQEAMVRVRSSDPTALADALTGMGHRVTAEPGDELLVTGATQVEVAEAAFDRRIVVYALAAEASSLEDVFFHLTTTPQELVS